MKAADHLYPVPVALSIISFSEVLYKENWLEMNSLILHKEDSIGY